MRTNIIAGALAVSLGHCFPFAALDADAAAAAARAVADPETLKRQLPSAIPPFDAAAQYVSNTGAHAFQAPSGDDQRGPCPGLNAMANHGYFPKNGVGGMADFVQGTGDAFGMGPDLAEFLAVYGAIFDGNLLEYSIGGPADGLTNLDGLLGEPMGLSEWSFNVTRISLANNFIGGSHNKYEGDVSPIKGDLYTHGNDYLNQVDQFTRLYELGMQNGGQVDLQTLTDYRVERFNNSISTNPYFTNNPFSGVIASPAAWTFVYRFMANKSEEYPQGRLDLETLKTFYAMTGDYPNFTYTPGHETFPDNWYKRNPVDDYTIPYFAIDAVEMIVAHPQFATLGGNTGKVNSFVGIEPANLTDGVFNAENLLQGNNALCYGLLVAGYQAPDILSGLFTDINPVMDKLGAAISNFTGALGCPTLNGINKNQFAIYPGYSDLKSDGTY